MQPFLQTLDMPGASFDLFVHISSLKSRFALKSPFALVVFEYLTTYFETQKT